MKTTLLLLILLISLSACHKDTLSVPDENTDRVAVLQVDYQTLAFEGATELTFPTQSSFTIKADYIGPSDFGNLKLYHQEAGGLLFDGDMIWMGKGELHYPNFQGAEHFPKVYDYLPKPTFEHIDFGDGSSFDNWDGSATDVWNVINDRQLVASYLAANPGAKIYYFLYRPSQGMGHPAEWDWILFIKK